MFGVDDRFWPQLGAQTPDGISTTNLYRIGKGPCRSSIVLFSNLPSWGMLGNSESESWRVAEGFNPMVSLVDESNRCRVSKTIWYTKQRI